MAREISRIESMLDEFRKLWEKYPDLRFGQLVCNIVPENQLEKKNIPGEILTTNYLNFSEPRALAKLKRLVKVGMEPYTRL